MWARVNNRVTIIVCWEYLILSSAQKFKQIKCDKEIARTHIWLCNCAESLQNCTWVVFVSLRCVSLEFTWEKCVFYSEICYLRIANILLSSYIISKRTIAPVSINRVVTICHSVHLVPGAQILLQFQRLESLHCRLSL